MPRPPDPTLPKCPTHSGSSVREQGTYGNPPRPRLRCSYEGADGQTHKHGLRPAPKPAGVWDELPGSKYGLEEVATALVDLARGATYTGTARRIQVNHGWADFDGIHEVPEATAVSGATVAGWLDRFGAVIAAEYAEREWPQSLVLDSTEFVRTNPRTGWFASTSTAGMWWRTGPSCSSVPSPTSRRRGRPRQTTAARSDPGPRY